MSEFVTIARLGDVPEDPGGGDGRQINLTQESGSDVQNSKLAGKTPWFRPEM
jgi:hypothetical protein